MHIIVEKAFMASFAGLLILVPLSFERQYPMRHLRHIESLFFFEAAGTHDIGCACGIFNM